MRLLLSLILGFLPLLAQAETFDALVIRIIDGDSLTVSREGKRIDIRLADIDAPEWGQPFGKQSRTSLNELAGKRQVHIDSRGVDQYGRTVARISAGTLDINREQVSRGLAWAYSYRRPDHPYQDNQDAARAARLGLWSQSDPQPPWQWRHAHPRAGKVQQPETRDRPVMLYDTHCEAKRYCKEMSSCDEAYFYLTKCGVKSLDGDGDGVPCSALCPAQGR